jgi:hypothetical protein
VNVVRGVAWSEAAGQSALSSIEQITRALRDPDIRV